MKLHPGRLDAVVPLLALALALSCGADGPPPGSGGPGNAAGGAGEPPPVPVLVATATRSTTTADVEAVGSLRSPETAVIAADVSGILVKLDAPEGRQVERGHLLAEIDGSEARAALQVAQARERNAEATHRRVTPLVEDGVIPSQALDDAEAELETARGLVAEARAALGKHQVRAPFTGLLSIGTAELGEHVAAGTAIARLTRMDPLEMVFAVPEESAGRIRVGQDVAGRVGRCGQRFEARVSALDAALDPGTRSLPVLARVPNPDLSLRPGMSARVRVVVGERPEALVVPHEALVRQGAGYLLWVLADDGTAGPRPVRVGAFGTDRAEIIEGIEEGAEVVVAGHQKLRPGARVAPQPWQPTDNPNLQLGSAGEAPCEI